MSISKVDLDRISVASPCPVAWDVMAGDDRLRFCNQCNLNVYNLSAMTKAEAESVITNTEGRVCARFYRRVDGTILTQDCPVGLRAIRKKVSRAAAAAFSALVSLLGGQAAFAQQQSKSESKVEVQKTLRRSGQSAVEGTVTDVVHAAIVGVEVKLINERTKREITTRTNESGRFRFAEVESGAYTIQTHSPGFTELRSSGIKIEEEEVVSLAVMLTVGSTEFLGIVVTHIEAPIPTNDTIPSGELIRKERPRE